MIVIRTTKPDTVLSALKRNLIQCELNDNAIEIAIRAETVEIEIIVNIIISIARQAVCEKKFIDSKTIEITCES